ncbi:DUF4360 domain-containing protein [Actinomadura sp. 9N215]|uniref:DUF4360 domain-containing protein n=1 Tax=Actinomadura sp. 9N215 TaxID=3375150 RepID=UPI0037987481
MAICAAAAAAAAALAVTATPVARAAAEPRHVRGPGELIVEIATINGSGCRADTVFATVSEGDEAFTVTYSDYVARTGGSSKPLDARKNCLVVLKVHVPRSHTYAISSTDHRGHALLASGAKAIHRAGHSFQGHSDTWLIPHTLNGAYDGDWDFVDRTPDDQLVFKECGEERNFNVLTELRVDKGASDPSKVSFITMATIDNSLKTTYHLAWKRCP